LDHARCPGTSAPSLANPGPDGRVTYELRYAPSVSTVMDSSKLAALEGSIADIEKQLGVLEPTPAFADLHTAVSLLQKRLALLDSKRIEAIAHQVHVVMGDVDSMLAKKAELQGSNAGADIDQKVNELYEFCHRWTATSASLPLIVSRLQTLQSLHQQSASFASRLATLETQQDELTKLLETTHVAVQELGRSLHENMTIVKENMRTMEEKMLKAFRK